MLSATRRGRRRATGRGALLAASLIGLVLCAGCGVVSTATRLGPARKVAIAIDGAPSALFAPIYEALANGDFSRGALSVSVLTQSSDQSPLAALASGQAQLAVVSEPALLAARDAGQQVVAIGALVSGPLESIISLSSPLTTPTQLIGHAVASDGSPLAAAELSTYLATASVPPARVRAITAPDLDAALLDHKASTTIGGYWDYDALQLALEHHVPHVVRLTAAGVPTFSELVIAVRIGEAHYDGPLLRALLQSLTRGEQAVRADPGAAASLLASVNPSLSKRFELAVLAATDPFTQPPGGEPFGYQNPVQWQTFANWMAAHDLLKHPGTAGLAITDEFLPGQGE